MLFYDDEGCRLFYEITRLPEYYLTRTETALLTSIAAARCAGRISSDAVLVEFGGSDETKARILLDRPDTPFSTYVSIDVAAPALSAMQARLAQTHPNLDRRAGRRGLHAAASAAAARFAAHGVLSRARRSAISTLPPRPRSSPRRATPSAPIHGFCWARTCGKARRILLPAYNDAAGVTAAFNLNLLRRLNREAGADFDLSGFRHEAVWNDGESRIEMHLISTRDQTVQIGGRSIAFREAEIDPHRKQLQTYPGKADRDRRPTRGGRAAKVWKDHAGLFGVFPR